jgi:ABC-type multidrug transport system permease subunit
MFRAHPFWFVLAVVLIAAFGIGIIILLYLVHQDACDDADRHRA